MEWYFIDESVTEGDRRKGPFSDEEIKEKAAAGEIKAETLVWHTGEENWRPWKEHEEVLNTEATNEIIQQTLEAIIRDKQLKAELKPRYAGFWIRALAYSIDFVILSFFASLAMYIMNILGIIDVAQANEILGESLENLADMDKVNKFLSVPGVETFVIACSIIQAAYFIIFNWLFSGTPGKIFLKLKIVRKDGEKLGLKGAVIRYVCSFLSSVSLVYFYGLAYIIAMVDPEKRTFHDWLARTRVVFTDNKILKK